MTEPYSKAQAQALPWSEVAREGRTKRARTRRRERDELLAAAYERLVREAARLLPAGDTEGAEEARGLVHDAYIVLDAAGRRRFHDRAEFVHTMREALRHVVAERAARRAPAAAAAPLGDDGDDEARLAELTIDPPHEAELLVGEAVSKLKAIDPRAARIVVLRFHSGLTTEETAAALGCSVSTIERRWRGIREWLLRELG